VVLSKENHTQLIEVTTLDRKIRGSRGICGAPFVCPAPTGPQPPPNHPPNPHGNINLSFVILKDDPATTRPVAVINEAFARRFFKNENPLGKHFRPDKIQYASRYENVGVVQDMLYMTSDDKDPIGPMYWISEAQTTHYDDPAMRLTRSGHTTWTTS